MRKFTTEQRVEMVTRRANGERVRDIAADFGCHPGTVYRWSEFACDLSMPQLTRQRLLRVRMHAWAKQGWTKQ
jgi:hypothetical protein